MKIEHCTGRNRACRVGGEQRRALAQAAVVVAVAVAASRWAAAVDTAVAAVDGCSGGGYRGGGGYQGGSGYQGGGG